MDEDIVAYCDPDIKSPSEIENHNSSLNTTVESHHESDELANDIDSELKSISKGLCFDIAAQLNLSNEKENDLCFNTTQLFDFWSQRDKNVLELIISSEYHDKLNMEGLPSD